MPTIDGAAHRGVLFCTGWVSSEQISRVDGQDYRAIPRSQLHPDPQHWPTRLRPGVTGPNPDHYYGVLEGGQILPPPGVAWTQGMGSTYG
ncbi:MAG TPA: hypothetical protein VG708_06745 [Mycobacteriales bacterium]|nr:hypothetical protein [Mycobacteriales bacterium]